LLAGLLLAAGAASAAAGASVILATTKSTQDTGLLDVLVPAFERAMGYRVKTIAVGTGAALAMGEKGDADVLLVHAPKAEEAYMAGGRGLERAAVMHDSFIVVGPAADPAKAKGAARAVAAFKRIALRELVRSYVAGSNCALVIATQALADVVALCERVILLEEGRAVERLKTNGLSLSRRPYLRAFVDEGRFRLE